MDGLSLGWAGRAGGQNAERNETKRNETKGKGREVRRIEESASCPGGGGWRCARVLIFMIQR